MSSRATPLKVDLHVHSAHSDKPYSWFLRSTRAAECYTPLDHVHQIAKRRGMDLVTVSDHDTIDGGLELCARYPDDTFLSVEVSARFPEDGCIVHAIVVDLTEAQHREAQRLRRDIYELVAYLREQRLAYFWCHPLSQVNGRLHRDHLERCFLMFDALEVRNGTRDAAHEHRLLEVTARLSPALLAEWAERHPQAPWVNREGRYALVGGSDDHGSLAIARAYTTFLGERSGRGLAAALRAGATAAGGEAGTGTTLAHNCYGVLAGYLHATGQAAAAAPAAPAADHADHADVSPALLRALVEARSRPVVPGGLAEGLWDRGHQTAAQEVMRAAAERALIGSWRRAVTAVVEPATRGQLTAAADALPGLAKALTFELPYLLAHRYHLRDRRGADRFAAELGGAEVRAVAPRVAVFTDTIDDVNGVALGLRRLLREARRVGHPLHVVGAAPVATTQTDADGAVRLPSVYEHRLAEYPDMAWAVPHLPAVLRFLEDARIDLVQCSTPGPVGVAAMIAGRLAGVPVIGQYHTDVPEYALRLTGDPAAAAVVRQIVGWFYRALDRVLAPTAWVGDTLRDLGVADARVVRVPRGIDLELFSPARRAPGAFAHLGASGPVALYVGRLSREKSLEHALGALALLRAELPDASLVLVGDGPLRAELARECPPGCILAGEVLGEDLARLYASADAFLFPSETETFGNAVIEAQAAGLPVIVAARGATREHVLDHVTGFAIDPRDHAATARALARLLRDPALRARMGAAATQHARRYDLGEALRGTLRCYARIARELESRPAPAHQRAIA